MRRFDEHRHTAVGSLISYSAGLRTACVTGSGHGHVVKVLIQFDIERMYM